MFEFVIITLQKKKTTLQPLILLLLSRINAIVFHTRDNITIINKESFSVSQR